MVLVQRGSPAAGRSWPWERETTEEQRKRNCEGGRSKVSGPETLACWHQNGPENGNGKNDPMRAQITHARSLWVRSPYLTSLPIWSNQPSKGACSASDAAAATAAAAAAGCDDEEEEEDVDEDADSADDTAAGAEDDV